MASINTTTRFNDGGLRPLGNRAYYGHDGVRNRHANC